MHSRLDGRKAACHNCGTPTMFVWTKVGPRGGRVELPTCPACGERPALLRQRIGRGADIVAGSRILAVRIENRTAA